MGCHASSRSPPHRSSCWAAALGSFWPTGRSPFALFSSTRNSKFAVMDSTPCPAASTGPQRTSHGWCGARRPVPADWPSGEMARRWVEADHQPLTSQERFTVVSYNILGVKNASKHKYLYPNVPSFYLTWDYRKRVICEELMGLDSDVICLQEVDRYFDLLEPMERAGYAGSYKRCTGSKVDGCAIFWKADRFRLLEDENIEFKQFGLRDNVAQLSVFEICRPESRKFIVCNIHVLFRPSRGDVKLGQIRLLLSRAQYLSKKWGNVPVIFAGDFNSTPQGAIYEFLSSSKLNIMLHDRRELSGQRNCDPSQVLGVKTAKNNPLNLLDRFLKHSWSDEEVKVATGDSGCHLMVHPFKLNSSYAMVKGSVETRDSSGEPLATSYLSKFLGTVDYLWYAGGVVPTRVLDTLPFDILLPTRGLPCKELGSDHLALVSEFAFMKDDIASTTMTSAPTNSVLGPDQWHQS